jgi:hypothetical protein
MARVGLLTETVLPGYINIYVSALNHALMRNSEAVVVPNAAAIPSMAASRLQLVDTASKVMMLSINEQRELLGYPPVEDEDACVPVMLEQLRRERLRVELAPGNVLQELGETES